LNSFIGRLIIVYLAASLFAKILFFFYT